MTIIYIQTNHLISKEFGGPISDECIRTYPTMPNYLQISSEIPKVVENNLK